MVKSFFLCKGDSNGGPLGCTPLDQGADWDYFTLTSGDCFAFYQGISGISALDIQRLCPSLGFLVQHKRQPEMVFTKNNNRSILNEAQFVNVQSGKRRLVTRAIPVYTSASAVQISSTPL